MKPIIMLLIWLIVFPIISKTSNAQAKGINPLSEIQTQNEVIFPFFMALKNGDVDMIKNFLSDDLYIQYKTLLEENTEYPAFLRNYYKGAVFSVLKVSEINGEMEFDVLIEFPKGSPSMGKLRVSEETEKHDARYKKNRWKINVSPFKVGFLE